MRQEFKYLITKRQDQILNDIFSVLIEKDENCKVKPYTVNSIYFDNDRDMDFHNGNDGIYHRKKHRLRYYNNDLDNIKLEKKEKYGNWSNKTSFWISNEEMMTILSGEYKFLNEKGPNGIDSYNHLYYSGLKPKVLVAYDRVAYTTPYDDIRITFDRNLRFCEIIDGQIYETMPLIFADSYYSNILEVKYNHFLPNYIKQVLDVQNLTRTAVSKYNLSRLILTNRK